MFEDGKSASLSIGAVSIFVGILQTLASFWAFSKLQEAHRNADIQWSKLHRFIAVEMTLPRQERITAKDMLKICRETIERLSESSPLVPDSIIKAFDKKFGKAYTNVAIPDVANGLKKISINAPPAGFTPSGFRLQQNIPGQVDGGSSTVDRRMVSQPEQKEEVVVQVQGGAESETVER
jgi:hypothetical protein